MRGGRSRLEVRVFGIGMQEIVLICAIALIVVGPKRLPEIARALGKGYAEFRRTFDDMKRNVEADIGASEIRRNFLDLPPPPPPPQPVPPDFPRESLLTAPPAPEEARLPYPGAFGEAPPPPGSPDVAAPAPVPEPATAADAEHSIEASRGRG